MHHSIGHKRLLDYLAGNDARCVKRCQLFKKCNMHFWNVAIASSSACNKIQPVLVKHLLSGKALGVTDMLKAPDIVGMVVGCYSSILHRGLYAGKEALVHY